MQSIEWFSFLKFHLLRMVKTITIQRQIQNEGNCSTAKKTVTSTHISFHSHKIHFTDKNSRLHVVSIIHEFH